MLVATGVKRSELQRFCAVGKKVFERSGKLYVFTDSRFNFEYLGKTLQDIKASVESSKKLMYTVDYK